MSENTQIDKINEGKRGNPKGSSPRTRKCISYNSLKSGKRIPKVQTTELDCVIQRASESSVSVVVTFQRTEALIKGLIVVLEHHRAPTPILDAIKEQLHLYLDSAPNEMVWLKRAKHALTYPLAKYLRNDPPPEPDVAFQPHGSLRKWMRQRLICFNRRNTHLWYSWYQAKRSALPASDSFVLKTYDEHFETLTRNDPGDDNVINDIFSDSAFNFVLNKIKKKVTKMGDTMDFVQGKTSNSASFENKRIEGGQHSCLLDHASLRVDRNNTELIKMKYFPISYSNRSTKWNTIAEFRETMGKDDWNSLWFKSRELNPEARAKCTIQAVLEPFKVRVISKGESLPQYMMRPLQKSMHSCMRKMAPFRLIGRPFCPTDMIDIREYADPDDEWFSVDYSAATDGLSWKYSGRILRYLISGLSPFQQAIALQVLGPHDLHYPDRYGKAIFRGIQKNGQLMGSILSFPILCISNLGVYLAATRQLHKERGFDILERLSQVLVNGDDMLYAAPSSLWSEHVRIGGSVGLAMSIGKSYHHDEYANINSTSVHYKLYDPNSHQIDGPLARKKVFNETPFQIDYLNVGLFFGQHKVQGRTEEKEVEENGDLSLFPTTPLEFAKSTRDAPGGGLLSSLNWLLRGSLKGREHLLLKSFLIQNAEAVRLESLVRCNIGLYQEEFKGKVVTRDLFVPISLGGMGIDRPEKWQSRGRHARFSISTKLRALKFIGDYQNFSSQLPLPGYSIDKISLTGNVPWDKADEPSLFSIAESGVPSLRSRIQSLGRKTNLFPGLKHLLKTGFIPFSYRPNTFKFSIPRRCSSLTNYRPIFEDIPSLIEEASV